MKTRYLILLISICFAALYYEAPAQTIFNPSHLDIDLYNAVDEHDVGKVRNLLERGANPNALVHGSTALARAAYSFGRENLEIAKMLIAKGACINQVVEGNGKRKTTPVFIVLDHDAPMLQLFIVNGADLSFPNPDTASNYYGLRPAEMLNKSMQVPENYGTNGYYTDQAMLKVINSTLAAPVQKCTSGASEKKAVNVPSSPVNTTIPYTIAPRTNEQDQQEEKRLNGERKRQELEQANERTRFFNALKKGCRAAAVCAAPAESYTPEANERTREYNAQKQSPPTKPNK